MIRQVTAALVVGLLAGVAFGVSISFRDQPDEPHPPGRTTIQVVVEVRDGTPIEDLGDRLVGACAYTVPDQRVRVRTTVADRLVIEATPALGEHAERRLVGCLGDLVFDHVVAEVRSIRHDLDEPAPP